jgi:hypothetical protein
MIVLNVYNGDILGIDNNLEYGLWYLLPLSFTLATELYQKTLILSPTKMGICKMVSYQAWMIGIINNLYWYYQSPFKNPEDIRHRTEYYDTQVFMANIFYVVLIIFKLSWLGYIVEPSSLPSS